MSYISRAPFFYWSSFFCWFQVWTMLWLFDVLFVRTVFISVSFDDSGQKFHVVVSRSHVLSPSSKGYSVSLELLLSAVNGCHFEVESLVWVEFELEWGDFLQLQNLSNTNADSCLAQCELRSWELSYNTHWSPPVYTTTVHTCLNSCLYYLCAHIHTHAHTFSLFFLVLLPLSSDNFFSFLSSSFSCSFL